MSEEFDNNPPLPGAVDYKPKILFVDDERNILNALNRLFFDENYEIFLAISPKDAMEILGAVEVAVIVTDQRMPAMSGVDFLIEAQKIQPEAIRILLTGYADIDAASRAVNESHIFRYLSKPWNDSELKAVIRQALEIYRLTLNNKELFELNARQNEELKILNESLNQRIKERTRTILLKNQELSDLNRQLAESFTKIVRLIIDLIESKSSELSGHCKRVAAASRYIASELELPEEDIETIEIAAMLHDIGKLSLSDQSIGRPVNLMSAEELQLWQRHPLQGERLLGHIESLDKVRLIIRHHHENYNGSGFPDKLLAAEIPIGSRIIAVADSFDNLVNKTYLNVDNTRTRAVKALRLKMGMELDPNIVSKMIVFLQTHKPKSEARKELEIKPFELKENMILSRDLYTTRGVLVFNKDKKLDSASIKSILDSERLEKLLTSVFIYD